MTNQLQAFHFEDHHIESFNKNNELFLRAIQLAEILGYKNPRDAIKTHVDKEDVVKYDTLTKGGKQKVLYVNESGMYALIFGSTLDAAKRFKKWVTSEVLPSIRKTGSYSLTINEEQQYLISKAVDERAHRTGEKHQAIYHKFYDQFKITSYKNLPSNKFDEAIIFLGGIKQRDYKAVNVDNLKRQQNYLVTIQEYYYRLYDQYNEHLAQFLEKTAPSIHYNITTSLNKIQINVGLSLNHVRSELPRSRIINFAANIDYLD